MVRARMLGVQEVGVRRKLVGPLGYGRWDLVGPLKKKNLVGPLKRKKFCERTTE